jgi:hypothetical protein
MNWMNIHIETLRGSEFVGAEPVERATWISLMGWSCSQENSGRIKDCKTWTSRKWQQLCGITFDEVHMQSELYTFEGDDLIVHFYPMDQQESIIAKRENGKKGGRPKKVVEPVALTQQDSKPRGYVSVKPNANLDITIKERKGKESNSKVSQKEAPARQEFPTLETIQKFAKSQPLIIQPDCAETYFNDMEACEWIDKHNRPIKNWQAALRAYASRWNQFSQSKNNKSSPSHHKTEYVKQL